MESVHRLSVRNTHGKAWSPLSGFPADTPHKWLPENASTVACECLNNHTMKRAGRPTEVGGG